MCNSMGKKKAAKSWSLLFLRLAVAAIFLYAAWAKFMIWNMAPSAAFSSGMLNLMRFLAVVEALGGIAVLIGFLTSWAGAGLSIIMLGSIYFVMKVMHLGFAEMNATGWEFNLMILAGTLVLTAIGGGKLSLDRMMGRDGWGCKKECGASGSCGCGPDKGMPMMASGASETDGCCGGNGACGCGK